jgi:hypothetical protein
MKTRKVKSWKSDTLPAKKMVLRMVEMRPETVDTERKTVQVVIASENPVLRYDYDTGEEYQEILAMDGVEFRTDKKQLPIVDSHDRSTVRNVLGSVRNVRVEGTQLVGDAIFARDTDSQEAFEKLADGHLTDFSITATPQAANRIRRGESTILGGTQIEGPAEVITSWVPTDASLVATGADETSTVRQLFRSYQKPIERQEIMNEDLKTKLVEKGLPVGVESAEEALEWMLGQQEEIESMEDEPVEKMDSEEMEKADYEPVEKMDSEEVEKMDEETVEKAVDRALKADRRRSREIVAICERANLGRSFADNLCNSGCSLDVARERVMQKMFESQQPAGTTGGGELRFGASSVEKTRDAMRDGLVARAMRSAGAKSDPFAGTAPAPGYQDFQNLGLRRLAEEVLRSAGVQVNRMTPKDIAMVALGHNPTIQRLGQNIVRDDAYHVTGLLPNLMLDAANKTCLPVTTKHRTPGRNGRGKERQPTT